MIELVILDFDGTLVESEGLASDIESEMLFDLGIELSPEEITSIFSGVSPQRMTEVIDVEFGVTLPDTFFDDFENRFFELAPTALKPTKNARQLLESLTTPYCLASNSTLNWIKNGLEATELSHFFGDKIFPASIVKAGKPAPDIFNHISKEHNVLPNRCLVVEDSSSGIKGALAANMTSVGYTGGTHCTPSHGTTLKSLGAHHIIDDLKHLVMADGSLNPQFVGN